MSLEWKFNPASGALAIYSTIPASLVFGVTRKTLSLSWPADHLGWMLQVQTNSLDTGLGTNWISIPASVNNTHFTSQLDPGEPAVFYRLIYQ